MSHEHRVQGFTSKLWANRWSRLSSIMHVIKLHDKIRTAASAFTNRDFHDAKYHRELQNNIRASFAQLGNRLMG